MTIDRFNYTDRDYLSLRDQMVAYVKERIPDWVPSDGTNDASDFATVFIEATAYMGDLLSYYVDRAAQEATPMTANSASNVLAWAELFGVTPGLAQSAMVDLTLTTSSSTPVAIPHRLPVRSTTGYQFEIMLNPDADGVVPDSVLLSSDTPLTLTAWEGVTVSEAGLRGRNVGTSTGLAGQRFELPEVMVDRRGIWVEVFQETLDGVTSSTWEFTYRLLDHGPDDQVFTVRTSTDNKVSIVFGDNVSGKIPAAGYQVRVYYRVTSGAEANSASAVPAESIKTIDASWDQQINAELASVKVTNLASPSGGVDPDSISTLRKRVTKQAGAQRRAVTAEDFEAVAMLHSGVLAATCSAQIWSRPTVYVLPTSQNVISQPTLKAQFVQEVQELLDALSMVGTSPDVFVGLPTPLNLTVTAYARKNIRQSAIRDAIVKEVASRFTYENLKFEEDLSAVDILSWLQNALPYRLVQYVYCDLDPVYPDQPMAEEPSDTSGPLRLEFQRFSPRPGELLYVDEAHLTVEIHGGIKDI